MRIAFDKDIPLGDQVSRLKGRKQKGHKHNASPGPGRAKPHNSNIDKRRVQFKRRSALIKSYWRGELQEYPIKEATK